MIYKIHIYVYIYNVYIEYINQLTSPTGSPILSRKCPWSSKPLQGQVDHLCEHGAIVASKLPTAAVVEQSQGNPWVSLGHELKMVDCLHIYIDIHIYLYIYTYVHIHMYIYIYLQIHIYIYIHLFIDIHLSIYLHLIAYVSLLEVGPKDHELSQTERMCSNVFHVSLPRQRTEQNLKAKGTIMSGNNHAVSIWVMLGSD